MLWGKYKEYNKTMTLTSNDLDKEVSFVQKHKC